MSAIFNDEKNSATADRIMACVSIEVSLICAHCKVLPIYTFAQHSWNWCTCYVSAVSDSKFVKAVYRIPPCVILELM